MTKKLHGVNLGGWLVVEKWMTPSLFAGTRAADEHTLMSQPDGPARLVKHRETFITELDFAWMHDHDVDIVRIPVGYWLFESRDGHAPAVKYLDLAMRWALRYGIRVLICLHGAPGSQNGKHHSGRIGQVKWFDDEVYREESIVVLEKITERYRDIASLWGIELLNEPAMNSPRRYFTLLRYYRAAYRRLTRVARPGTYIVYHDGFQPLLMAGALWKKSKYPIAMDAHWYGFSSRANDFHKYVRGATWRRKLLVRTLKLWQPIIIGEWSGVMPRKFVAAVRKEREERLRRNIEMQLTTYRYADGWMYWNYKVEKSGDVWSYRDLVENGTLEPKKTLTTAEERADFSFGSLPERDALLFVAHEVDDSRKNRN